MTTEMQAETQRPLSGRRAEAARNDGRILAAAREVFTDDPAAPIQAVAARAGVGIGALYRRYGSKETLLATLCDEGLSAYVAALESAVADDGEPWPVFEDFMQQVVDAGAGSLTRRLAGTFTPTPELFALARRAQALGEQLIEQLHQAGVLREDFQHGDLGMIYEQLASVRLGDEARTRELRRRYLVLLLAALRARPDDEPLPGSAPTGAELTKRWQR